VEGHPQRYATQEEDSTQKEGARTEEEACTQEEALRSNNHSVHEVWEKGPMELQREEGRLLLGEPNDYQGVPQFVWATQNR